MPQVSSSGVASGLDINSLVKQLVGIERKPIGLAQQKQIGIAAKLSAFTTLGVTFSSLKSTLTPLQSLSSFQSKSVSVTDSAVVTATVNDSKLATLGSSTVSQITSLAQAQKLASASFTSPTDSVGTGTITIKVGSGAEKAIAIDADHANLTQIRDKINAANAGVTASILKSNDKQYKLVVQSTKSGTENTVQVSVVDGSDSNNTDASGLSQLANLTEIQSARDAQFLLDGAPITRSSNVITDAIDGVTLTLVKKTAVDGEVGIGIKPDTSAIKGKIEAFVSAYNEVIKGLNNAQAFDAKTLKKGALLGNTAVQGITNKFRLLPKERVPDLDGGSYTNLSEIGITSQEDGTLSIDSGKLTAALEKTPLGVGRVFALFDKTVDSSVVIPTSGIADRLLKAVSDLLDKDTGRLSSEERGLRNANAVIDKEVLRLEKRVSDFEKRTREKFARLEGSLSRIQGVGSALGRQITQLENLSTFISRRNSSSPSTSGG